MALGTVEDGEAAGLVFYAAGVVAVGTDTNADLGDFAMNVLTAAPPLPRGKKKPSLGVSE